jgi:hypothetical protein
MAISCILILSFYRILLKDSRRTGTNMGIHYALAELAPVNLSWIETSYARAITETQTFKNMDAVFVRSM